jgi:hypothetical protein
MFDNDGKHEIYIIQWKLREPGNSTYHRKWQEINFDSTWVPKEFYKSESKVWDEFSACGKCWQETSIYGTYDVEIAIKLFLLLKEHSFHKKDYMFRVSKLSISQFTEVVWGENG